MEARSIPEGCLQSKNYTLFLEALKRIFLQKIKEKTISIFLFVENSFYGRIIIEINALPHAK